MTDHCQIWNNADRLETDWGLNRISYTAVILRGRCFRAYVVLKIGYERSIYSNCIVLDHPIPIGN